ncbi:cupin domain-containing protein [Halotalea alkalilenta]|uniref:cupin domain-containing protein n=1 Tax=Halotalea alkalilenta TaxID=376489 RepID=UPI0004857FC7|nr:cupin domain-containing protein [Halotalea alkalilenta]
METDTPVTTLGDLPMQRPQLAVGETQRRARFFNSGNAFNLKLPEVPAQVFGPGKAAQDGVSREIHCDQADAMEMPGPATTPLMLARYLYLAEGEPWRLACLATGVVLYVIEGEGACDCGGEDWGWGPGDIMLLPGDAKASLCASAGGAVLWAVSNEPQFAFEHARPAGPPIAAVHYPAAEIETQLALIDGIPADEQTSGAALIFASEAHAERRNLLPSLTLSLNTLSPGGRQRAHRHNSAAITLILQGENCHSLIDGIRHDWRLGTTMVTPPGALHSHHNDGGRKALFLIVQDGGLHYHARSMGFRFGEG